MVKAASSTLKKNRGVSYMMLFLSLCLRWKAAMGTSTFIIMKNQLDPDHRSRKFGKYKGSHFYARKRMADLIRLSERTQADLQAYLTAKGVTNFRSYWITNAVAVDNSDLEKVDPDTGNTLLSELTNPTTDQTTAIVSQIFPITNTGGVEADLLMVDQAVMDENYPEYSQEGPHRFRNLEEEALPVEYHISWVNATDVWSSFTSGEGSVIGVIDTGVIHTHPALVRAYRGTKKYEVKDNVLVRERYKHDYNWFDATSDASPAPTDTKVSNYHGSHVTGIAVGGHAAKIGLAPESKFIACRVFTGDFAFTVEDFTKCLQFMFAPHDLNGENPKVRKRPQVINMSFECLGCKPQDFEYSLQQLNAVGVATVASAGNRGFGCQTIINPPGYLEVAMSVGALLKGNNFAAFFSSRGPVTQPDGTELMKPDVVAPGTAIKSVYGEDLYFILSGTSMSAPVVAGAYLLLHSICPEFYMQDVYAIGDILKETALNQKQKQCTVNFTDPGVSPNNQVGYGTINVYDAAVYVAENCKKGKKGWHVGRRARKSGSVH